MVPNWQCNGTDGFCSKLGPFMRDDKVQRTDGSVNNIQLIVQDIRCIDPSDASAAILQMLVLFFELFLLLRVRQWL